MGLTAAGSAVQLWRKDIEKFWAELFWADWSETATLRTLLYRLYGLIERTPPNLLQKFDQFSEEELTTAAYASMPNLSGISGVIDGNDEELLWNAAIALRALDELLKEGSECVIDAEAPRSWLTTGGDAYVVPVPRTVMTQGGPRTGQSFNRRGLLYHRIIPARVGDVDVLIEAHPDVTLAGSEGDGRLFGAALFPDFQLNLELAGNKGFLVASVSCSGGIGAVAERHCNAARAAGCDTLLWPELTMDPECVSNIRTHLAENPLATDLPPLVVAGSWHVPSGEHYHNLAPVLDGRGSHILTFGKSRLFSFNGLTEKVQVYDKVHIVATDRELIAFAICKDFCDKAIAVPVHSLDVDLVLVPSMGQSTTITAHRDSADIIRVRYGARAVVVQQTYPVALGKGPLGYVLRALKAPNMAELHSLAEDREFTKFHSEK